MKELILLTISIFICHAVFADHPPKASHFNLMSLNIRNSLDSVAGSKYDGDSIWENRKQMIADTFRTEQIDIGGLQEAYYDQIEYLALALPDFSWVGKGRDDGNKKGEAVPIFYNKTRYSSLGQGIFWLSPQPDRVGSVGWDASMTRIASWVKLKDNLSGKNLLVFNAHFDHKGVQSRQQSAQLLQRKAREISDNSQDAVVIIGDLNFERSDQLSYQALLNYFKDAREESVQPMTFNTAQPYTYSGFGKRRAKEIDYIFVNNALLVNSFAYKENIKNGVFASDHLAVISNLSYQEN